MAIRKPGEVIRKVDGQLQVVSEETAQQLGQDIGVPAVTSPLQGAMVGANKDQAKMLGSQMNLRSAVRARTDTQTLDRAQRTQQYETQLDEETKRQKEMLDKYFQNIPGIGKLDEELAAEVARRLDPAVQASEQILGVDWTAVQGFLGGKIPDPNFVAVAQDTVDPKTGRVTQKSLLTRALQGEQLTEAEIQRLQDGLATEDLSVENLKEFVKSPEDQLAEQILAAKADEIRIGDLDEAVLTKLGLTDDYMDSLFGKDNWEGMTYAQLKTQVEELQAGFADVRELQRLASDPFSSATMRREANKRLRELGYLGKRSAMEKVNDLEAQIEDGDTIRIGESVFEIEEILEDDDWIEAVNFALTNEKSMESLAETQPELAKWLKDNRQALTQQLNKMTGRLGQSQSLADILVSEAEIADLDAGYVDFDPAFANETRKLIFGDIPYDELSPAQKQQLNSELSQRTFDDIVAGVPTSFYADRGINLKGMSEDEIQSTANTIRTEYADQEYNTSEAGIQYNKNYDELAAVLKQLGETPPEKLSAQEWMWEGNKPSLVNELDEAKRRLRVKQNEAYNRTAIAPYAALSEGARKSLGLWAPAGERIPEPKPGSALFQIKGMLSTAKDFQKQNIFAFTEFLLKQKLPEGILPTSVLGEFLQKNTRDLMNSQGPEVQQKLQKQVTEYIKDLNTAFPKGVGNFNATDALSLAFGEAFDPGMLSELRKTKLNLPTILDKNKDGILDDDTTLTQSIKTGLLSKDLATRLTLSALQEATKTAKTELRNVKEVKARKETYDNFYKQEERRIKSVAQSSATYNVDKAFEQLSPQYVKGKLYPYELRKLVENITPRISSDLAWIRDKWYNRTNALSDEGKSWAALSPMDKEAVRAFLIAERVEKEKAKLLDSLDSRAKKYADNKMRGWKYEG